jgi:hypothetical protein
MLIRTSFRGKPTGSYFIPARTALAAAVRPSLSTFVSGYRSQLRDHRYRITGTGTVGGRKVYWIEGRPEGRHYSCHAQAAAPVRQDGRP